MPPGLTFLRTERITFRVGPPDAHYPDRATYLTRGKLFGYPEFDTYTADDFPLLRVSYPRAEPLYARLDLAGIWDLLRDLPDLRLVRTLIVVDGTHEEQTWLRQETGQSTLTIRALADTRGFIRLFLPVDDRPTAAALQHEWCHLLKFVSPDEARAFEHADAFEPMDLDVVLGDVVGAWTSVDDEVWATIGETLLRGSEEGAAAAMAQAFPIRSALWGRALARRLSTCDPRSRAHEAYESVSTWLEAEAVPEAIVRLRATAHGDIGRSARLLALLERRA